MRSLIWTLLALCACQGEGVLELVDTTTPTGANAGGSDTGTTTTLTAPTGGGCGDVRTWPIRVEGTVVEPNGTPVNNAEVRLEDRGWNPSVTTMGAGQTNAQGRYDFEVPELIDVEDCWGVLLNYYIVAERGPAFGEDDVNPSLLAAINDQSLVANLPQLVITAP